MRKSVDAFIAISLLATVIIACTAVQSTNPPSPSLEYHASPESTSAQSTVEPTNTSIIVTPASTATTTPRESPAPQVVTEYTNLLPSVSAGGQFVVFTTNSRAILGDNAPTCYLDEQRRTLCHQVVRYDARLGQFLIISASLSDARLGNQVSQNTGQAVSADGGRIVFTSLADNLTENVNPGSNIFLSDLNKNEIYNLTPAISGTGASYSQNASLSADGNYVVFASTSQRLGGIAAQTGWNVYLYDVKAGKYTLVSQGVRKPDDFGDSLKPSISPNGRWIAFWSWAGLLEDDDSPCTKTGDVPNPCGDIYRYDVQTGQLTRFNIGEGYGEGFDIPDTSISNSGRWILAGSLLIDMAKNVSVNLHTKFTQSACGAVLAQNTDAILYFSSDQLRLMEYDLNSDNSQLLFDITPLGHLTDTDRSTCDVNSVSTSLLSASLDNLAIAFVSARGLNPKDASLCQDGTLKPYNCLDIYLWQGQDHGLTWIAP
jgi:Tol biopolymer transport system component